MSLQSHLSELSAKHKALESQISDAQRHSSIHSVEITRLKRRKLHLKDEIQRVEGELASN